MTIKAIETLYKGYRFRSRLEARWAVFFNAMGISFEYELEGFEVDDERYLPDFKIAVSLGVICQDSALETRIANPRLEEPAIQDAFSCADRTEWEDDWSPLVRGGSRWVKPSGSRIGT